MIRPGQIFATVITILAMLAVTACRGSEGERHAPVPRPTAYPRITVPDSAYTIVTADGVRLTVNESAGASVSPVDNGAWVDIDYGGYGSPRIYLTVTDCADVEMMEETLANRQERMALNLGSSRFVLTELTTPSGWQCAMAVARTSMTTPVQILAHNDSKVLSGAFTITLPDSISAASDPVAIAPIVDVAERDMLVMLKSL